MKLANVTTNLLALLPLLHNFTWAGSLPTVRSPRTETLPKIPSWPMASSTWRPVSPLRSIHCYYNLWYKVSNKKGEIFWIFWHGALSNFTSKLHIVGNLFQEHQKCAVLTPEATKTGLKFHFNWNLAKQFTSYHTKSFRVNFSISMSQYRNVLPSTFSVNSGYFHWWKARILLTIDLELKTDYVEKLICEILSWR